MFTILTDSFKDLSLLLDKTKFVVKDYNKTRSGLIVFFGNNPTNRAKNICQNNDNYSYLDLDFAANLLGLDIDFNKPLSELKAQVDIQALITKAINTQGNLSKYQDDIFSMSIPNFYKLDFDLYLGENPKTISFIKKCIQREKRLIIEASAGTGKTTLIKTYLEAAPQAKRLIFLVPTLPIAEQTEKALKNDNLYCIVVCTSQDKIHSLEQDNLQSSRILICVYDSLYKVIAQDLIQDSVLVVDEYHMIVTEKGYRKTFEYNKILEAQKVIFLSATPNYFFTLEHKLLNFKLLKCYTKADNILTVFPIYHNASQLQLFSLCQDLIKKYNLGIDKKILIKKDSKKWIDASIKNASDKGLVCESFYSGDKQRKEDNPNYLQALETGLINDNINLLFVTRLLEAGFSLKQDFDVVLTDIKHWSNIVQTIIRPRYNKNTGTNKNTKVLLLQRERTTPRSYPKFRDAKRYILDEIRSTEQEADKLNTFVFTGKKKTKEIDLSSDIFTKFVRLDIDTDLYGLDVLKLLFDVHLEDIKTSTLELNLERVKRIDNRIKIQAIKHETPSGLICPYLQEIKDQAKVLSEQAEQEAVKDLSLFCYAIARSTKNKQLKADLTQEDIRFNSQEVVQAQEDLKELTKTNKAKEIFKNWLFWKNRTSQDDLINFVLLDKKASKTAQEKRVLWERSKEARKVRKGQEGDISKHKNYENDLYLEVRQTIRERNKQQRKNNKDGFLSLSKLAKICRKDVEIVKANLGLKTCDFDSFTDRKILQYIKAVFNVETKVIGRGSSRETVYYLSLK